MEHIVSVDIYRVLLGSRGDGDVVGTPATLDHPITGARMQHPLDAAHQQRAAVGGRTEQVYQAACMLRLAQAPTREGGTGAQEHGAYI